MLRDRVQKFLDELEMPITVFCKKIEISPSYFYKWRVGKVNFSEEALQRVSDYITKYGFWVNINSAARGNFTVRCYYKCFGYLAQKGYSIVEKVIGRSPFAPRKLLLYCSFHNIMLYLKEMKNMQKEREFGS